MVNPARRPRSPEAGFSYLEVAICVSILTVLLGCLFTGLSANARAVGASLDDADAGRAAAARLEVLRSGKVAAPLGTREFAPDPEAARLLPGLRAEEEIREVEPGLLSIVVRMRWNGAGGEERRASLTTLLARGAGR